VAFGKGERMMGRVTEKHVWNAEEFDLEVLIDDDGGVTVDFYAPSSDIGPRSLLVTMPWDEFREVIDFVCKHGLGMDDPYVVPFTETVEGAASLTP